MHALPNLFDLPAPLGAMLPEYGADLINRATTIALMAHAGQTRKDGCTPQLWHPLHVQRLLAQTGVHDPLVHALALVHDAVEDNPGPRGETIRHWIQSHLGTEVAAMLDTLTDPPGLDDETRKQAQAERLATADWRVQVVKLADVVAGIQEGPAPHWNTAKMVRYVAAQRRLVDGVLRPCNAELAFYFSHGVQQQAWALAQTQQG
jgi:(p)ppGpp synthase/HD superfamily hydrolase